MFCWLSRCATFPTILVRAWLRYSDVSLGYKSLLVSNLCLIIDIQQLTHRLTLELHP